MRFGGIDIASAIEKIVAAIVDEHGFMDVSDVVTLGSSLHDDLGMDEVDLIEVLFRAEERFGLVWPDNEPRSPAAICRWASSNRPRRFQRCAPTRTIWPAPWSVPGAFCSPPTARPGCSATPAFRLGSCPTTRADRPPCR